MEILALVFAIPFLLFLPGYFVTQAAFPRYDQIENATLSVALSMFLVFTALFGIERLTGKLTSINIAITIFLVNLICLGVFLFARSRIHSK